MGAVRAIPAWAGNATGPAGVVTRRYGPSPRGRGTRTSVWRVRVLRRAIPAWAGNARTACSASRPCPGHPRVGGERLNLQHDRARPIGPSPRGRGTLDVAPRRADRRRAIPAWAGNASPSRTAAISRSGHPRVGGERSGCRERIGWNAGPSPRGRGTPMRPRRRSRAVRAIPAWAGNAPVRGRRFRGCPGHPRVGGERLHGARHFTLASGPSPRGRGTPPRRIGAIERGRAIPAWAGNALLCHIRTRTHTGHPRVGGERANQRRGHRQ